MKTMTRTVIKREPRTTAVYIPAELLDADAGQVQEKVRITLLMGQPVTTPCLIPVLHSSTPACINNPFMVNGDCYKLTAMSFGNAHGAVFVDDVDALDLEVIGAALGTHVLFPVGASIVFVEAAGKGDLKARLWQNEIGEIPFTPEAVSVAGTAAMMLQKVLGTSANISMGGEDFQVKWDRCGSGISLTGPASMVAD